LRFRALLLLLGCSLGCCFAQAPQPGVTCSESSVPDWNPPQNQPPPQSCEDPDDPPPDGEQEEPTVEEIDVSIAGQGITTYTEADEGEIDVSTNGGPSHGESIYQANDNLKKCGAGFSFSDSSRPAGTEPSLTKNHKHSASPPASSPAGQTNETVAIADFNGDGVIDSALINSAGIRVTLYNAAGATSSTATYPIAGIGASILTADFNGDGIADLAVTQSDASGQGNAVILLGKGDGTFGPATKFPAGPYAYYLATGDFNGDGFADLAVTNSASNTGTASTVSVLIGKGDGSFASPVSYAVGNFPGTIAAGDFNGDGKVDLAALENATGVTYENKVWVLLGKGDGTFQPAVSTATGTGSGYLAYADLNHDGKLDLVIADEFASAVAVMMGNGDGTFQASREYVIAAQPISIAVIPLEDGNTWLLTSDIASGETFNTYVKSNGAVVSPQLHTIGQNPAAIAAGDLNGDSSPDLVITDSEAGAIYVALWNQNQFGTPVTYSSGSQPGAVAIADVNGDGKPDVIAADVSGIDVLLGNGNGTLGAVKTFAAGGSLSSITIADFNSDGKPDVAAANAMAGGASLLLGNGDGTFQSPRKALLASGLVPLSTASGDINGDGKPDLIVAYNQTDRTQPGGIAVLLGKGDGTFQTPVNITLPGPLIQQITGSASSAALAVGDINGDGKLDVVTAIQGANSNQIAVLLGDGKGSFKTPILTATNTSPPMLVIADINLDGKPDLVLADCCGLSEASYLAGNGDGTFQAEWQFPSGPNPVGIAVGAFGGDRRPDMAIVGQLQMPNQGTLAILYSPLFAPIATAQASVISAADSKSPAIAPGSLATAYGADLASSKAGGTPLPLPTSFGGTSVSVLDSSGKTTLAPLLYVTPTQVNFEVPPGIATGAGTVTVNSGDGTESTAKVQIAPVAPGIFELNSDGLAAAYVTLYHANGTQTVEQVYTVSAGAVVANPVSLGSSTDKAYLFIFGTGFQAAGTSGVKLSIDGTDVPVSYAGPQGGFVGLDQANALLPASLKGAGKVTISVTANGLSANAVNITVQ
jgi:uncharacterized protein (TIGR03437 family)